MVRRVISLSDCLAETRKLSIAPMLDWTDRHCRYFMRLMSRHALLYTEMVTTGAIIHGKGDYLGFNQEEHPVALQLGGSDPSDMAHCALIAQERGYDEVNINVGCPSDRVQNGRFGACLMAEPETVASCFTAMQDKVSIPVTVKCRIGIDEMDDYEGLSRFIKIVSDAGCSIFVIHARKAWLQGLSPKQNREVPPLNYQRVYKLKEEFPHLSISINGGITSLEQTQAHLKQVDGVMIGREAYSNPAILLQADNQIFGDAYSVLSREKVIHQMIPYIQNHIDQGGRFWHVARHMLGLFQGQPGGKLWRRYLSQNAPQRNTDPSLMLEALTQQQEAAEKVASRYAGEIDQSS